MAVPATVDDADNTLSELPQRLIRHTARALGAEISFRLRPAPPYSRAVLADALADAVGVIRAADLAFNPARPGNLVSWIRDRSVDKYPPVLADVIARCAAARRVTRGHFDPWATPDGFDPSELVRGWAVEQAAQALQRAGIADFTISAEGDVLVRGRSPSLRRWRVGVRHPRQPSTIVMVLGLADRAVSTAVAGRPTVASPDDLVQATVVGPDLASARVYAKGLLSAGRSGLDWFPPGSGYDVFALDAQLRTFWTPELDQHRASGPGSTTAA